MAAYGLSAVVRLALHQALQGFHDKCSHDAERDGVPFAGDAASW